MTPRASEVKEITDEMLADSIARMKWVGDLTLWVYYAEKLVSRVGKDRAKALVVAATVALAKERCKGSLLQSVFG